MLTNVATLTLLVMRPKVVKTATVITNSLAAVVNVRTSTNVITGSMYVIKALLARTMLVHILAYVLSGISVTALNA